MDFSNPKMLAFSTQTLTMSKQFYFDKGVWENIIGFVDIKPFKKDTFVNGTYSARVPGGGFNETIKIVGRTPCFVKGYVEKSSKETNFRSVQVLTRKKIFIKDGIEYVKMNHTTITAHENERYMFSTKKEWERFRKGYHSGPPSECESESESESESDVETSDEE